MRRYCGAADPLAVNDDSLTPLDMARQRGHVSVVRMIEVLFCSIFLLKLEGGCFMVNRVVVSP